MSIHNLKLVIFLSLSVALCGQAVAQSGSGTAPATAAPATQAAPTAQAASAQAAPATQAEPVAPSEDELKSKFGVVMGYNMARNFKAQNPGADYAQILEGLKAAEGGEDRSGYVFGYQMMTRMKDQKVGLTSDHLGAGIKKAMAGEQLGMTDQEAQMLGMAFSQMVEQNRIAERKKTVEDNKAKGEAYIAAQKASNPNIKELSDGIYYEVLKEGAGEKPGPKAKVSVDYTGRFVDGEVFDSSVKPLDGGPGQPAEFPVGGVIPGFSKALMAMPAGSKWRVLIPGDQAYGMRGSGGKIGPMQTLVFELELLKIVDSGEPVADKAPAATAPKAGE